MAEAEVRRRLAAILAADAAGYTRLMADDEQATITALDEARAVFRDQVAANNGRVVDTAGDSVLAVFETAGGAVEAAIAIQGRLADLANDVPGPRQLRFRIGVHLGDINEKSDGTIYGDGVNVAARLEGLAEPSGVVVSDAVQVALRGRVEANFQDLGAHQVKNVAEPVRAYHVSTGTPKTSAKSRRAFGWPTLAAATAVVMVSLGVVVWAVIERADRPDAVALAPPSAAVSDEVIAMPTGPSVAVLPFENLSDDPEQEYFSDGLTEDIITALSRFTDLFVIARGSTFQYKNADVDVREVGKKLGARYVVEGSVRKAGDRIRVSAQLSDATTGAHLWADSYDRTLTAKDLFTLQDDIREHIVAEIGGSFGAITRSIVQESLDQRPSDLDAYTCVLRARDYYRVYTPTVHLQARNCLEAAVTPESTYAEAWANLGLLYLDEWRFEYNTRPEVSRPLDLAFEHAKRAVDLDANSQDAQHSLFKVHFFRQEIDKFLTHAERALAINPNNAGTLAEAGFFMSIAGFWDRGLPMVRKAAKLNPNHPGWYHTIFFYDHYRKGEYELALTEAQKMNLPKLFYQHAVLAAVYGQLGQKGEAAKSIRTLLEMYPNYPENARDEWRKHNFEEGLIDHLIDGLRKAGLDVREDPVTTN